MATLDELTRALVAADKAGDATAARVLAGEITRVRAGAGRAQADTEAWAKTINPTEGMSGPARFAAGLGKAAYDTARGIGQLIPGGLVVSREDVAESRKRDAPLMNTGAGLAGDVVGNLAIMAPSALLPGAGTVLGGARLGAGMGFIQPSASTGETATNTLLGFGLGATVPAISRGVQTARAAAEPFYEAGQNRIVGRALNRAAGQDAGAVAARLTEAASPFVGPSRGAVRTTMGEYVPGSLPTVGQAGGNAGLAALERAATAGNPEVTNAVSELMARQNAARVGALDTMSGTAAERLAAEKARDAASKGLYETATRATYTVDSRLADLLQRPAVRSAMERAKTLAANQGRPFSFEVESRTGLGSLGNQAAVTRREITGQGLQDLKMAMDEMLTDPASGFTGKAGNVVKDLRGQIVKWMEEANPDFRAARTTFSAKSQPLNQMDVARELRGRPSIVSPLSGNLQPAAFARALVDEGLPATATGFRGATWANSVDNAGQNQLNSLLLDVQRANAAQTVGRGVGSDTVQKLAYQNILEESGLPTVLRAFSPLQVVGNVGARMGDAAYARANRELGARLAEVMLDPAQAATLMLSAGPAGQNELLRLLARTGSGLALAAPALSNAAKQ